MPRARAETARGGALVAGVLLAAAPACARPLDDLQQADAVVQTVGWRLSHANARYCTRAAPAIGLILQDAQTFEDPAGARAAYGLAGDIAVAAVAEGGPAAQAGLEANDTVLAIAGAPVAAPPPTRKDRWARVLALQSRLEDTVAQAGKVTLALAGARTVEVRGQPACRVRFMLDDGGGNASSSRDDVRIGRGLFDSARGDEALVAAVAAHELAHAVLDHQSTLEANDALAVVRRTEREADRLSVWLLANAGYPPEAGARLAREVLSRKEFLIAPASHGGWRSRAADMTAEQAAMAAAPDRDWQRRFRREGAR
ncbi:PDZ domain-containing protein [Novosphingobium huizhouense]|uniref:PDZ domain-containing protein n=1 Tax=Novosphingobium huizhouense TaxID=2866625 RepID=UPI001CD88278|nr:PDZ domain-containing protein [Novosphingobium huizhouense]